MKIIIIGLCCIALAVATPAFHEEWKQFKSQHKLTFHSEVEDSFRFKIFIDNLKKIQRHNQEYDAGKKTYKMALNKFSHLLSSEFSEMMLMKPSKTEEPAEAVSAIKVDGDLPDTVDWREKGAVTPVKDQGQCGSCWAFSATGVIESANFLKNGELISLSEKNLMDCCWSYGNLGCSGGDKITAMQCVVDEGGIDTEESYAYVAKNGKCNFKPENVGAVIAGYERTVKGDEEDLKRAVATVGPIAVSIYVIDSFQSYAGGVYVEDDCPTESSNHAVLAVGYGTDEATGLDYWLVKNSWGDWGEDGYIRMVRNVNNICGIANKAAYPTF